jgi:TP901 family phage tail tape measure protein
MPGLTGEVANLIVALKLDDRGFSGKLNGLARQLKGMDAGFSQIGRGTGQVASGIGRIATVASAAAVGGLTAMVTTAASFEQAWAGVLKTTGAVGDEAEDMRNAFEDLARTTPVTFQDLAAIGEMGGALGIANDDLDEFTDLVARLGVSTDLTFEGAADAVGKIRNVLHLNNEEMFAFGDALVALGNAGASTESQIVEIAQRFAAAAQSAGLSMEATLALSSTVASMGIEAEAGGSSLSRLFNSVATNIGTANEKAQAFAGGLDMSLGEFRAAWENDAEGVFVDLLGYLNTLDQFEAAAFLKEIGITNTRDVNTLRLLAQGSEEYARQLDVAAEATGAVREESDAFFNTTQGKWQIFQNNVALAADAMGQKLLPIVNEVMEELVGWLNDPATQRGLEEFGDNLAQGVRDLVAAVKDADFGPLISTMKGAAEVAKGAFAAFNALPEPVKQLAIAALVANKVTGGAVGSIASGLGNILMGGLKLAIPALSRGTTPANPMFVKEVGLGGAGGLGGAAGAGARGGFGGLLSNALKIGIPALLAAELARTFEPVVQDLAESVHDNLGFDEDWNPFRGAGPDDWQWPLGSKNPPDWLPDWLGGPPPVPEGFSGQLPGAPGGGGGGFVRPGADAADADRVLLEQFGGTLPKLATNEVIQHLERTNEIGLEGVGTSFQVGIKDGLDPIGDVATRILERAENPKDPAVMREIEGHIAGLEEIQATYLATGDVTLARKVQDNIDTLHTLIGTTDTSNAIAERAKAEAAQADAAMLSSSQYHAGLTRGIKDLDMAGLGKLENIKSLQSLANTKLSTIAAKNFSPHLTAKVNVNTTVKVSTTIVKQQVDSVTSTIGGQGGQTFL